MKYEIIIDDYHHDIIIFDKIAYLACVLQNEIYMTIAFYLKLTNNCSILSPVPGQGYWVAFTVPAKQ